MTTAGGAERTVESGAGTRLKPWSVSELNRVSRETLESRFLSTWLVGEISNFKPHSSGHWYFSLKDDRAQIGVVMFRYANSLVRFRPTDGMKVVVRGTVTLYEPRGQYQINAEAMEPKGLGELQAAFEQLKARLRDEGLFDDERKRPLPPLPCCVGVVTSPTGAALRDILRVFDRRGADLRVVIAPCCVQGDAAAGEIVEALRLLEARGDVEVIIVGRGGGSLEDLWAFNEERVARAIAASSVPIVSAVGHETDFTISDFVADLRAPTPSAAAEMILKSRRELMDRIASARAALQRAARLGLSERRRRLESLARSRGLARVESRLREALQRGDDLGARLSRAGRARVAASRARLELLAHRLSPRSLRAELQSKRARLGASTAAMEHAAAAQVALLRERLGTAVAKLDTLSPLGVLERGYAICHDAATGAVLTEAKAELAGRDVRIRLARGRLLCEVTRVESPGE